MNESKITWREFKSDMSKVVLPALVDSIRDIFLRAWSLISFKSVEEFLGFLMSMIVPAIGGVYFLTIMMHENLGEMASVGCFISACILLRIFNNSIEKRIAFCKERLWESGNAFWTMTFWILFAVLLKLYGHHIWGLEHVVVNPDKKYLALVCLVMCFSFKSK